MVDISSSLYAKDANNKTLNIVHTKYGEIGFDGDADKVNLNWYKSADLKTIKLLKKAKPDYEIYFETAIFLKRWILSYWTCRQSLIFNSHFIIVVS